MNDNAARYLTGFLIGLAAAIVVLSYWPDDPTRDERQYMTGVRRGWQCNSTNQPRQVVLYPLPLDTCEALARVAFRK